MSVSLYIVCILLYYIYYIERRPVKSSSATPAPCETLTVVVVVVESIAPGIYRVRY